MFCINTSINTWKWELFTKQFNIILEFGNNWILLTILSQPLSEVIDFGSCFTLNSLGYLGASVNKLNYCTELTLIDSSRSHWYSTTVEYD